MTKLAAGRTIPGRETQMFGRYRLLGRLAAGGMAEVWAAQLLAAGGFCKAMVIKRVLPELASNPSFLRMLMNEARVAARLSHANICSVFELGEVDGEYYIAMEYLRGAPLTHLLKVGGAMPPAAAVAIVAQACDGLHYAHEQNDSSGHLLGLVHRDVSPHNLFVTADGVLKVLDFGIAKVDDGSGEHTEVGKVKGKLSYMSPEQLAAQPLDRRSDVWSLGVVLWELLTGRRLFGGASPAFTVDAIRNARIPLLATAGAHAPELDEVLARAMCRSREWRYANAAELRTAILAAFKPNLPAPSDALSELVWARAGTQIRGHDRMFDDEELQPNLANLADVVERLPLRADETQPSYDMEIEVGPALGDEPSTIKPMPRPVFDRESAAMPTVVEPAARVDRQRFDTIDTVDMSDMVRADTSPEIAPISAVDVPRLSLDPGMSGVMLSPSEVVVVQRRRAPLLIGAFVGVAALLLIVFLATRNDPPAQQAAAPGSDEPRTKTAAPGSTSYDDHEADPVPVPDPVPVVVPDPVPVPVPDPVAVPDPVVVPVPVAVAVPDPVAVPVPDPVPTKPPRRDPPKKIEKPDIDKPDVVDKPDHDPTPPRIKPPKPPPPKPGKLSIVARPWATIFVDGRNIGQTPIAGFKVSAGDHTVKAVAEDGRTKTIRIHVEPGGEVRERVKF